MYCCSAADVNVTWSLSVACGLIFPPRGWKIPAAVWLTARLCLALTDSVQDVMQGPNRSLDSVVIIWSITKRSTGRHEERSITPVWLYTHDRLHGELCSLWLLWVKRTVRQALVASLRCEPVALITHAHNAATKEHMHMQYVCMQCAHTHTKLSSFQNIHVYFELSTKMISDNQATEEVGACIYHII